MKRFLSLLLILMLLCTSCQQPKEEAATPDQETESTQKEEATQTDTADPNFVESDEEMFSERDQNASYDASSAVTVQLQGNSIAVQGGGATVSGSTVTLTREATYLVSGTLEDGMILVDAGDQAKVQIVLQGASVTSASSAPLYVKNADKVFVTLADGTANSLANGGTFTAIDENNINAALYSKQDVTLSGGGSLTVTSPAGHGISSKDNLAVTGGTYTVQSASHGLDANDSIRISAGNLTLAAGKDGIHAENTDDATLGFVYISGGTFDIDAEGDGISAGNSLQIQGGTFDLVTGGGSENGQKESSDRWGAMGGGMGGPGGGRPNKPGYRPTSVSASAETEGEDSSTSMKGLKSGSEMKLSGGTFTMDCADDAIHSNGSVLLEGGAFTVATGDDGIHADATLTITAGTVNITQCYEGLEALDIAVSGGDIKLVATDDGLNAAGGNDASGTDGGRDGMFGGGMGGPGGGMGGASNGSITVSGGTLYINSSGDGMDANGTLTISGGKVTVVGPTQGDTATLDYDKSAVITGGTFIGTGASGMAQTFSASEQGVIAVSVGNQAANTTITVQNAKGETVLTYAPELPFAVFIYSDPALQTGATYTITVGSQSGSVTAN